MKPSRPYPGNKCDAIVRLFARLNPYDRGAVKGSILKIEDDNFDPETKEQRQLWCLAISAKRYALFLRDRNGEPALLRRGVNNGEKGEDRWSEHGLGHLMNPTDPDKRRSRLDRAGVAWDRPPIARPSDNAASVGKARGGRAHDRKQPRGDETAKGAQRREALCGAD